MAETDRVGAVARMMREVARDSTTGMVFTDAVEDWADRLDALSGGVSSGVPEPGESDEPMGYEAGVDPCPHCGEVHMSSEHPSAVPGSGVPEGETEQMTAEELGRVGREEVAVSRAIVRAQFGNEVAAQTRVDDEDSKVRRVAREAIHALDATRAGSGEAALGVELQLFLPPRRPSGPESFGPIAPMHPPPTMGWQAERRERQATMREALTAAYEVDARPVPTTPEPTEEACHAADRALGRIMATEDWPSLSDYRQVLAVAYAVQFAQTEAEPKSLSQQSSSGVCGGTTDG